MEPINTTVSPIIAPSMIFSKPCKFVKLGELILQRKGEPVPSEIKWKPSSPLGA